MTDTLPEGWQKIRLGDLVEIVQGQSPPGSTYNEQGHGMPFFQGKAEFGDLHPVVRKWTTKPTKKAQAGDILISVRAPVGPTNVAAIDCAIGRGLAALRPSDRIDGKYLLYAVRATAQQLASKATGTTFSAISGKALRDHLVPLAPFDEQQRIVAAIEEQFSRIDAGLRSVDRTDVAINQLDRAALTAVTCGFDPGVDSRREGEGLRSGWKWATIEEVSETIVDCEHSTAKFVPRGIACVDTTCISPGRVLLDRLRFVDETTYVQRTRRLEPKAGDVIFAREGTVGTAVAVPENLRLCLGQRVMLFRPSDAILSNYLVLALNSDTTRTQYLPKILGTTAPHLNVRDIKRLLIAVPPLGEQEQIVAHTARLQSLTSNLRGSVVVARRRAQSLRQAILKAAFAGSLIAREEVLAE